MPIDLYCSLIFMPSVTEIQLNKLRALFPARFAPIIERDARFAKITSANRAGKSARSLFNCISVTDGIKIKEQYKSIGIGPLYLQTEFEVI